MQTQVKLAARATYKFCLHEVQRGEPHISEIDALPSTELQYPLTIEPVEQEQDAAPVNPERQEVQVEEEEQVRQPTIRSEHCAH